MSFLDILMQPGNNGVLDETSYFMGLDMASGKSNIGLSLLKRRTRVKKNGRQTKEQAALSKGRSITHFFLDTEGPLNINKNKLFQDLYLNKWPEDENK